MKRLFLFVSMLLMVMVMAACGAAAEQAMTQQTDDAAAQWFMANPLPTFNHYFEAGTVRQLYFIRNDARNTWTVWRSDGTGMIEDWCPSVGYGIPYDTSLTNPLKPYYNTTSSGVVVEQPEPNLLFPSKNTKATWVLCIRPNGKVAPVYVESTVTTYPWPIDVVDGKVVDKGEPASSTIELPYE